MKIAILTILLIVLAVSKEQYDWTNVQDKINYYMNNGAFTGGVLRVANGTHNIYTQPFGHFTKTQIPYGNIPFTNETLFDLASLTKVTATLSCIMHLVDKGLINVDDLVTKYIP
jgi:CubicO group peptidase (beta-lactamase class C family)